MLGLITRFIPKPWMLLAGLTAALSVYGAGIWTGVRVVKGGEVTALEKTISDQQAYYRSEARIKAESAAKALSRANERVTVREVIRYVKDSPDCDLPPVVARVLDNRVQGRPVDAGADSPVPPRLGHVSQGQSLNALDRAAESFYGCRDQLIGINARLQGCQVLCQ